MINGLRGKTTQLYGRPGTLRDYIFAGDLARFVVEKIFQTPAASAIHYVVSARPTSIFELQVIAERILRRKLYITYRVDGRNTTSVSFAPSIKATGVYVSDLNTRMSVLARRLTTTHVMGNA